MKPSVCTITFRHHLLSFGEIVDRARSSGFDGIELWGAQVHARRMLAEFIGYYHPKDVRTRSELGVFAPENVYSAAGTREGMVPLCDRAMDYDGLLSTIESEAEASLEWFGSDCLETLIQDRIAVLADLGSTLHRAGSSGRVAAPVRNDDRRELGSRPSLRYLR